ncbi:hypothetical protein B0H17DRAFT_41057 [Mycena rosella]|uniref:Uncharacterized protein n=1 Tax=Mycena rosella TaxID=1033263 RepID=A0AAD7GS70_MYCRO|nr:hypothetical protein B0H17DRAFT_41057 [Mycena rosella]
MLLLVAQLMVRAAHPQIVYLLSTIVQLRASFPPPPLSFFPPSPTGDAGAPGAPGAPGGATEKKGETQQGEQGQRISSRRSPSSPCSARFHWAFVLATSGSLVVRWTADRVK